MVTLNLSEIELSLFNKLLNQKKLTSDLIDKFQHQYGETFFKALDYIQADHRKVLKFHFNPSNLVIWIVEGNERNYILYPDLFCGCDNFLLDSIYRSHKFKLCKHLLAQKIAQILELYNPSEESDNNFSIVMKRFVK